MAIKVFQFFRCCLLFCLTRKSLSFFTNNWRSQSCRLQSLALNAEKETKKTPAARKVTPKAEGSPPKAPRKQTKETKETKESKDTEETNVSQQKPAELHKEEEGTNAGAQANFNNMLQNFMSATNIDERQSWNTRRKDMNQRPELLSQLEQLKELEQQQSGQKDDEDYDYLDSIKSDKSRQLAELSEWEKNQLQYSGDDSEFKRINENEIDYRQLMDSTDAADNSDPSYSSESLDSSDSSVRRKKKDARRFDDESLMDVDSPENLSAAVVRGIENEMKENNSQNNVQNNVQTSRIPSKYNLSSRDDQIKQEKLKMFAIFDEEMPEYTGLICPNCKARMDDEEMENFGKCTLCRQADLRDPSVHKLQHSDNTFLRFPSAPSSSGSKKIITPVVDTVADSLKMEQQKKEQTERIKPYVTPPVDNTRSSSSDIKGVKIITPERQPDRSTNGSDSKNAKNSQNSPNIANTANNSNNQNSQNSQNIQNSVNTQSSKNSKITQIEKDNNFLALKQENEEKLRRERARAEDRMNEREKEKGISRLDSPTMNDISDEYTVDDEDDMDYIERIEQLEQSVEDLKEMLEMKQRAMDELMRVVSENQDEFERYKQFISQTLNNQNNSPSSKSPPKAPTVIF